MHNIPVLNVHRSSLAEAYEEALLKLYKNGCEFKTQYDKPGDPLSLDATMNITVEDPLADPMIHKAFPGGIEDLREYVYELEGLKDGWVKNLNDEKDTRWEYTYHQRFANWGSWKEKNGAINPDTGGWLWFSEDKGFANINQIEQVVEKLCKQPFTRQAQMITWMPNLDMTIFDPPCLQSWWGRILEDENGVWWLNYNMRIRSNDAWGAYFMNTFGLTMMTKHLIADEIAKRTGRTVNLGRMNWQADSWHIYGKDIKQFKERLLNRVDTTSFTDRIYNFYDEDIQAIWKESEAPILEKIRVQSEEMKKGYV
jgi:thymidylate synthase